MHFLFFFYLLILSRSKYILLSYALNFSAEGCGTGAGTGAGTGLGGLNCWGWPEIGEAGLRRGDLNLP